MRIGIHLPEIGRKGGPAAIRRAAVQAEELGFDDVWTTIPAVVDGMRSLPQLCKDPSGFVEAIASRIGIDPSTLRQGYSEPVTTSRQDAPALPSRGAVIRRYLDSVRILHGVAAKERPSANTISVTQEVVEP